MARLGVRRAALFRGANRARGTNGSIDPIDHTQARHKAEVAEVAGDEHRIVGQGDAGDQQVAAADLFQALYRLETLKTGVDRVGNTQNWYPGQENVGVIKQPLRAPELVSFACL